MKPERLNYLFQHYFDKTATEQQRDELMRAIDDPLYEQEIKSLMEGAFISSISNCTENEAFSLDQKEKMLDFVFAVQPNQVKNDNTTVKRIGKISWIKYAASAVLLLSVGLFFFKSEQTGFSVSRVKISNDIKPGGNNAILTLSNGSKIVLNDAGNGTITQQGNASVVKLKNGELAYRIKGAAGDLPLYNTMSTPRGGQYKLQLPDGTLVMLNSESSITYPIVFTGKERNVSLTGEAYFEVAKNKKMPFHVKFGDQQVEVLGTHFNICAYKDQSYYKTTLLEGSVRISNSKSNRLLVPGQQAVYELGSQVFAIKDVDTDDVIAWKNGLFLFDNTELDQVMLQLSRWYNVEVEYDGPKPTLNFTGAVKRDNNLSRVIKILESTGGIKFTIDGNKIIVRKK